MAITPEFLFNLESNMRLISEREYARIEQSTWAPKVMKTLPSGAKKEHISWILSTAMIEATGTSGGEIPFDDLVMKTYEVENTHAASGLKITKDQLDDLDGNGVNMATEWSSQIGVMAGYWPQQVLVQQILANPIGYDAKNYFATDHPVNPYNSGAGTYSNLISAKPIDDSVSLDTAYTNLMSVIATIRGQKMPNGKTPRFLKPAFILAAPRMAARLYQLTNAKFIAQVAGSGAGSGDITGMINAMNIGQPIIAEELGSGITGTAADDTSYYVIMENITSSPLGAWLYLNREPFSVIYHGPQTDAQLAKMREFQWTIEGRNAVVPGHPYLMAKVTAA